MLSTLPYFLIRQWGLGLMGSLGRLRLRAQVERLGAVVPAGDRHEQVALAERVRLVEDGRYIEQQGVLAVVKNAGKAPGLGCLS